MNLGLKGRVALVTGASKGIGKAIARGLADEGVNLVLLARGNEALEQAADRDLQARRAFACSPFPPTCATRPRSKRRPTRAKAEFGTVHILVNNAGGRIKRQERQITWPDTDWLDDVNIKTIGMLRDDPGAAADACRPTGRAASSTSAASPARACCPRR